MVVVSPDVGGVARARALPSKMKSAAIIDKRRTGHNMAESLTVIGDVSGRTAVLIDDMIDTGGTICAELASASTGGETGAGLCDPCGVFPTGFRAIVG